MAQWGGPMKDMKDWLREAEIAEGNIQVFKEDGDKPDMLWFHTVIIRSKYICAAPSQYLLTNLQEEFVLPSTIEFTLTANEHLRTIRPHTCSSCTPSFPKSKTTPPSPHHELLSKLPLDPRQFTSLLSSLVKRPLVATGRLARDPSHLLHTMSTRGRSVCLAAQRTNDASHAGITPTAARLLCRPPSFTTTETMPSPTLSCLSRRMMTQT